MGGYWVTVGTRGMSKSDLSIGSDMQFSKLKSLEILYSRPKWSIWVSYELLLIWESKERKRKKCVQEIQHTEKHKVFLIEDYNNNILFDHPHTQ